jgi:hypothetical protein
MLSFSGNTRESFLLCKLLHLIARNSFQLLRINAHRKEH